MEHSHNTETLYDQERDARQEPRRSKKRLETVHLN